MDKTKYDNILKIIEKEGKTPSEKKINKLLLDLGLNFLKANYILKRNNKLVGQIDGLFSIEDDYLLIVETEDADLSSRKISTWFTKWTSEANLKTIFKEFKLPRNMEPVRLFINYKNLRKNTEINEESLKHILEDTNNKIIYKDDIDYFIDQVAAIGSVAQNDLINFLRLYQSEIGQTIKTPALRIFMGRQKAYIFSQTVDKFLKSCYISRKLEGDVEGYQRVLKVNRINKIHKAIEGNKIVAFPNSLILSADFLLEEKPKEKIGTCYINFPNWRCSLRVVDGQHRLLGFSNIDEAIKKDHWLPVVAFDDMKKEDEIKTFITINTEQKKINPNLALILKTGFLWEKGSKFFDEKQAALIIKKINDSPNYELNNKIYLGYNDPQKGKIALATLVSALLKNNLVGGKKHLMQRNLEDIDLASRKLNNIFKYLIKSIPSYSKFDKLNKKEGLFLSNKGIRIILRMIQFFIRNSKKKHISEGLLTFFKDLNKLLTPKIINDLGKYYGEGGANKASDYLLRKLRRSNPTKYSKMKLDLRKV